jgi:hypothetical protein
VARFCSSARRESTGKASCDFFASSQASGRRALTNPLFYLKLALITFYRPGLCREDRVLGFIANCIVR